MFEEMTRPHTEQLHTVVALTLDLTDFRNVLGNLGSLARLNSQALAEVSEQLVGISEAPEQFFTLQSDEVVAADTGELRVSLNPSDSLLGFCSTLGARYVD